jgi:hypothetical protein
MQAQTTIPCPPPHLTAEAPGTARGRQGAQRRLAHELAAAVAVLFAQATDRRNAPGHQAVVRHGDLPAREVPLGGGRAEWFPPCTSS